MSMEVQVVTSRFALNTRPLLIMSDFGLYKVPFFIFPDLVFSGSVFNSPSRVVHLDSGRIVKDYKEGEYNNESI